MKSSGAVFTRQNPFQSASRVGKAHYHPSKNQSLTRKTKKTTLSPVRLKKQPTPDIQTLGPKGKQSVDKRDKRLATSDGQADYAELWPSTDCGSSPASSTTSSDMEIPKQSERAGKSISCELRDQEDSVLAKYIERFRHGRPQSREERQVMAYSSGEEQLPFWWISPSSLPPSSPPTKTTDEDVIESLKDDYGSAIFSPPVEHQRDKPLSPCRRSLSGEFDDTEILHLQERASKLLLRGESSLSNGSVPISSEGLECSEFSSPVSVDEPVQRPLNLTLINSAIAKVDADSAQATASSFYKKVAVHSLGTPTRPEEDILFQWRLRRKMEQAREWPQSVRHASLHGPTFSWQATSLRHPSATEQDYKQQYNTQPPEFSQKATHPNITSPQPERKHSYGQYPPASNPPPFHNINVSASPLSHPQAIAHVPAHMHFLCDVLPCPVQSSTSAKQSISQTLDESQAKVVCEKTKDHGNSTEEPTLENVSSSRPASTRPLERDWPSHCRNEERNRKEKAQTKSSERAEMMTLASTRKQRKSARTFVESQHSDGHSATNTSLHQRLPKKFIARIQQQGAQELGRESCYGDDALPTSPIHRALGQVVSEVLFPTVDSSPAQKTLVPLISPLGTKFAPPQSPVPPCSAQNSVEVISQLLQEAEDSDEKEFDDDPLLQVLRKQRKWVKEQLSEVDTILNEFLDEQRAT